MIHLRHEWTEWKTFFVVNDEPPSKGRTLYQSRKCTKCREVQRQEIRD